MIEKGHSTSGPFRFFWLVFGLADSDFRGFEGWEAGFGGGAFWEADGSMVLIGRLVASFCGVQATLGGQTWVNLCSAIFQLTSWG